VRYPNAHQPETLAPELLARHARYLLLNLKSSADREMSRMAEASGGFRLADQQGQARLYEAR